MLRKVRRNMFVGRIAPCSSMLMSVFHANSYLCGEGSLLGNESCLLLPLSSNLTRAHIVYSGRSFPTKLTIITSALASARGSALRR